MAKPSPSCSIFVGNVPYDANEDEMREIFGRAGQVTSVRVVLDKDTKQPKGYAFIDFADSASVQAAIEKISNYEYNGRKLRVDGAEHELNASRGERGGLGDRGPPGGGGPPGGPGRGGLGEPPPLPSQPSPVDRVQQLREEAALEQAKASAQEAAERSEIARLMETLTPLQVLHIVGEMQRLTVSAPEVAKALVGENVQLGLALQHAEFLVGLLEEPALPTDAEVKERAKSVREKLWQAGGPAVPPPPPQTPLGAMPTMPLGPAGVMAVATGAMTSQFVTAPYGPMVGGMHVTAAPTALHPGTPYVRAVPARDPRLVGVPGMMPTRPMTVQPPGAAAIAPPSGLGGAGTETQRAGLLERLVQLSPAQIDQLPHDQKVQLLQFLQTLPPAA